MRLCYRLESDSPYDTIDPAASWRGLLGDFDVVLHRHRLVAISDRAGDEPAQARLRLEPLLRDWETVARLRDGYSLRFGYEGAGIGASERPGPELDRSDAESAPVPVIDAIVRRHRPDYPPPDPLFQGSAVVTAMTGEIAAFRADAPSLPLAAQRILRILNEVLGDAPAGPVADEGLRVIAQRLNIDGSVLATLADLSARGVDAAEGLAQARYRGAEWQWMQEALSRLTLQAGRATHGPSPSRLSMDEFAAKL